MRLGVRFLLSKNRSTRGCWPHRLLKDVPNQPSEEQLENDPNLCRFVLVFDREGYSPAFFKAMWEKHRIGCMTYHKFPDAPWPEEWFAEHEVIMPNGEVVKMLLCERGSLVGSGKDAMWMRQVRKLTDSGHQTSIVSTAFDLPQTQVAARMFSRWCQENFFNYMSRNSLANKLRYRRARFAEMTMYPETSDNPEKYDPWLRKKAELLEEIEMMAHRLSGVKAELKRTDKRIDWKELNEKEKFYRLVPGRKRLMDTIRMIAYRAETAMAGLITGPTVDSPDARSLLQGLFLNEADILPDPENEKLNIRVHGASWPAANRTLALTQAEIKYPGTELTMTFELGGYTPQNQAEGVI